MISSYEQYNYAEVFYAIITGWRPGLCVELGVLHGYSIVAIALGLQKNKAGHLVAYDLFEDYQYNHGSQAEVQARIEKAGVQDYVILKKEDAFGVHNHYTDGSVYLLHIDLSNTGETVRFIMDTWDKKMIVGGIILFEGGTEERDQVEWMTKYNKEPMKPEIEHNPIIEAKYIFGTYLKYPGLTMLLKKRE